MDTDPIDNERGRLIPTSGRNGQSTADPQVTAGPEAKSKRSHNNEVYGSIRLTIIHRERRLN
jgi:hypothetical protein